MHTTSLLLFYNLGTCGLWDVEQEEASLNAQALKRQVADGQKLADRCKVVMQECVALTQESARLENECKLYHNDREVFMEAADEAEERAAAAEERALAAERRILELVARLESLQQLEARLDSFEKPKKVCYLILLMYGMGMSSMSSGASCEFLWNLYVKCTLERVFDFNLFVLAD
jgi:hypothetical protein